ncbi:MAG: tyrosine-type recombinase/integrase [Clostridia bacterium]|nr:tyrosine-type recombinase/integrase [Clostridia bacterium]
MNSVEVFVYVLVVRWSGIGNHRCDFSHNTIQLKWLNDACTFFGDEPIEFIDTDRIQDYINSMQHLTTDTIKKKVNFLSQMFNIAVEKELVKRNPTKSSSIKYGGQEGKGITALPKEKVRELVDKIRIAPSKNMALWLALMLYAGMRREEALGLRWEDIDFDTGFLHIERSVTYPSSRPVLGPPKTKGSDRTYTSNRPTQISAAKRLPDCR